MNTNNDVDMNSSNSDNDITNTGNTVVVNNNFNNGKKRRRRSVRSILESFLDPSWSSQTETGRIIERLLKSKLLDGEAAGELEEERRGVRTTVKKVRGVPPRHRIVKPDKYGLQI